MLICLALPAAGEAAADAGENGLLTWDLGTLAPDTAYPSQIAAQNVSCPGRHDFLIRPPEVSWLRLKGPALLEGIPRGEVKTTAVEIDTTGLGAGEHEAVVEIECVTCPPVCIQNVRRLRARLELPAGPDDGDGGDGEADGPCECAELEALWRAAEEALETAEAELERLKERQDELQQRRQEAEAGLEEAEDRVAGLREYFDESSWIAGERGRITRGDLELLREVRRDVYDRWKAGEITAEEAADAWGEIDAEDLEELRAEKRQELEEAEEARGEAEDEVSELGRDAAKTAEATDRAEDAWRQAKREAEKAKELYEACRAQCRDALLGRIDDHGDVLDELERTCPPIPWEQIEKELEAMGERSQSLAEAVNNAKKALDENLHSLLRAQELNRKGQELPAMPEGLWDWGEDVGRALGRPFGLEELGGEVGEHVAPGLGAAVEGVAGFPVGTDAVKAVGSAYKGVLGALHPDSVSLGRCIHQAFPDDTVEDAQWKRAQISQAWKLARSLDDHLAELVESTRELDARRQEIGELTAELKKLGEAPEAPESPAGDPSLEELARHEEELRQHRKAMEDRCARQQELLKRLHQAMGDARGALSDIERTIGTLERIAAGAALYREFLRRVGPLNCL